ncbi:MAG: AAA family ATPase [Verrucomicrobiota bacterium]
METDIQARIRTEIELAAENSIIINQEYLDDEQLTRERQFEVLTEIFNMNVRDEEIRAISHHFSPVFRNGHPIHLSVLGKTGTGKTISLLWFLAQIQRFCEQRGIPFRQVHLDLCCPAPCFRALNTLACMFGASKYYKKGISLEELMSRIEMSLQVTKGYVVIFVDEADNVRTDFNTFYQFLIKRLPQRISARLILIFVSNRLNWTDNLDPRVKSCLKVREMIFEPYDAESLRKILEMRLQKALRPKRVEDGVVAKIAALSSRQHGDARKAVNLLTRSAYLAERLGQKITLDIVDRANEDIERDKYLDMIRTSPKQLQAALYAALTGKSKLGALQTGDAHLVYTRFCNEVRLAPISQRAFSDLLYELDMYGYIRARTVSRGRYGRTKEIHVSVEPTMRETLIRQIRKNFDLAAPGVTL